MNFSNLSRWPLFIAYTFSLYVFFTLPPDKIPSPLLPANDKILHLLDFFLLTLLGFRTFSYSPRSFFSLYAAGKAAAFSLFYSGFLECVQLRVPGRSASLADWVADALGTLAASGILWISRLTPLPSRARVARAKNP